MALVSTRTGESVFGNLRAAFGTFTQAQNDVGGDIDTGLSTVLYFEATGSTHQTITNGLATIANDAVQNAAGMEGHWMALGY